MRRRWATVLMVGAAGAGVPAAAQLTGPRAEPAPAQVSLTPAAPAFTVAGMVPGDAMTRCFAARNEGTDGVVLAEGMTVTGTLAPYLRVTAVRGTGSCESFTATAYAWGTQAGGVAPTALRPEYVSAWAGGASRLVRVTVALPADAPAAAMAKQGTVAIVFAGAPLAGDGTTPDLPGGIAPGTTGGFAQDGTFLTNAQIKKRLRIGRARLLKNGDVVVNMFLPAGGAIRAKVILPNGVYYAHTLLPEEWGPKVRVLLRRRAIGRVATVNARKAKRRLRTTVTTRYRWAHGPDAFVQPEQKLTIVTRRR